METKTVRLTSLDPTEYPDKIIVCRVVDNMKEFTKSFLVFLSTKGEFPQTAKKTSLVKVRKGIIGEDIDTRPRVERDGKVYVIGETKGKVKIEGSMIVKNPDGEEYIVKAETFAKKYKSTDKEEIFEPIGDTIKYVILDQDIAFKAPWGEDMFGMKGSAINILNLDDIYLIQNEAFNKTYTTTQKND